MLSPRRSCLDCSKVCCDVREIWFMAWNQNTYVTYYILHIQYTNSEISIGLLYIHPPAPAPPPFVWWQQLNHCHTALSRNFPTSILVRASRCFFDIPYAYINHFSTIRVYELEKFRFQSLSISTLSCLADSPCMAWSKLSNNIEGS